MADSLRIKLSQQEILVAQHSSCNKKINLSQSEPENFHLSHNRDLQTVEGFTNKVKSLNCIVGRDLLFSLSMEQREMINKIRKEGQLQQEKPQTPFSNQNYNYFAPHLKEVNTNVDKLKEEIIPNQ